MHTHIQWYVYRYSNTYRTCMQSHFTCVWLSATLWTVTHQAPLYMGFSRWEHWRGLPGPPAGDLPHPGTGPSSPALTGRFSTTSATICVCICTSTYGYVLMRIYTYVYIYTYIYIYIYIYIYVYVYGLAKNFSVLISRQVLLNVWRLNWSILIYKCFSFNPLFNSEFYSLLYNLLTIPKFGALKPSSKLAQ